MSDLEKMSEAFDQALLKILKDGREVINRDGDTARVEATAADLNVVRQRLKDCGITAMPTASNPIGNIVAEMQMRGLSMPEVDDGEDAATA